MALIGAMQNPFQMQIPQNAGPADVTVDDNGVASDAPLPQAPQGSGLIGALGAAAQDASTDPNKSKTLLSALGSSVSDLGNRLTSLSPNASQALIASGLTMLANNDGSRNLGQLVGLGGISGLNTYDMNRQQQAENAFAQQRLLQQAQQQSFENSISAAKLKLDQNAASRPFEVNGTTYSQTPTGYAPLAGGQLPVARTQEITNADGSKAILQLDRFGNPVGQPISASPASTATPVTLSPDELAKANQADQAKIASGAQTISNIDTLSNAFNQPGIQSGLTSKVSRGLNGITGGTDTNTQVRQQFDQFRTQFINQSLPPGSASDADIRNAQATVPPSDASPDQIQQWLSVARKAQQKINSYTQAQQDFRNNSRGGTQTLSPIQTPSGTIPAGTDFNGYMQAKGLSAAQTPPPVVNQQAFSQITPQQQKIVQDALASGDPNVIAKLKAKGYIRG